MPESTERRPDYELLAYTVLATSYTVHIMGCHRCGDTDYPCRGGHLLFVGATEASEVVGRNLGDDIIAVDDVLTAREKSGGLTHLTQGEVRHVWKSVVGLA